MGTVPPKVLMAMAERVMEENAALRERVAKLEREAADLETVHPFHEWHDDDGPVLWYSIPVCEPAFHIGTPSDSDWPWDGDAPESHIGWARVPNPCRGISQSAALDDAKEPQ